MPWVKLDDDFSDHRKIMAVGPLAAWMHVCALCYCARLLTDGFIPAAQVRKLADVDDAMSLAELLVREGLWERVEGGYRIHDYLEYNPSKEQVEATKLVRAEAGKQGGIKSGATRQAKSKQNASPVASTMYEAKTNPVPVPVPGPDSVTGTHTRNGGSTQGAKSRALTCTTSDGNGTTDSPSKATWRAYKQAYIEIYKVEPVQNAKVSSQVKLFVQRVPAADAPLMAAWFLRHRGQWYVREGHSMGSLLKDCEKLHTEWLTGVTLHQKDAHEIDRVAADKAMFDRVAARVEARNNANETE
jgi:hypothetical protein